MIKEQGIRLMVIGAHPDDCESKTGGIAVRILRKGGSVLYVSATNGNAGHHVMKRDELKQRRFLETRKVAEEFGIQYHVMDNNDGDLQNTLENRNRLIGLILLGFKDMTGSTTYTKAWQFTYQFVYDIIGVALTEEFIFRGYIFKKLLEIRNSRRFAILISSLLFGLFHIFNGNLIQVFMTAFLGFLFCMLREKIKGCTLLSLIIAHGIYDALIVLWVSIL
jgi:hypothetical protein